MVSNNTKRQIDYWENKTSVFVGFFPNYIQLEGTFSPDELSEIAGIQRKWKREIQPVVKANQKGLFDG